MEEDLCRGCCIHSFQQSLPEEQRVIVDVSNVGLTPLKPIEVKSSTLQRKYEAIQLRDSQVTAERKQRQQIDAMIRKCNELLKASTVPQSWRCEYENRLRAITNQLTLSKTNYSDLAKYVELEKHVEGIYKVIDECLRNQVFPLIPFNPLLVSGEWDSLITTNEKQLSRVQRRLSTICHT